MRRHRGFTLIEVLVAIGVLGILMSAVMVSFDQSTRAVTTTQEHSEVLQNVRAVNEQLYRELSQAIINNNRPDGEQIYFQIRQISPGQSVIRMGCTTERGLMEIGYQVKPSDQGWHRYELWRLEKRENMWDYSESGWPRLNFNSSYVEPFAFTIIGFEVRFWSPPQNRWVLGNWESIERNALPPKVRITIRAVTESRGRAARDVTNPADVPGVETFHIEVLLPQAR